MTHQPSRITDIPSEEISLSAKSSSQFTFRPSQVGTLDQLRQLQRLQLMITIDYNNQHDSVLSYTDSTFTIQIYIICNSTPSTSTVQVQTTAHVPSIQYIVPAVPCTYYLRSTVRNPYDIHSPQSRSPLAARRSPSHLQSLFLSLLPVHRWLDLESPLSHQSWGTY